jgi:hypothetical protein
LLIFACSEVNTHEDVLPQSKYSLIKQNAATYFSDYANAFQATGHKYFGQAHDGTFDNAQFGKDVATVFSEKHPSFQSPAANKLLIQSWNPKEETLVDYMNHMGVSENVAPYVLEVQNSVLSSFDIVKLKSKEQDMNQVVSNIVSNIDRIQAKIERDKSLNEADVISLLIATTAAKSLTSAIVGVTTEFFTNLNVANGRNQASLRGFWQSVRAVLNVVTTAVVRATFQPFLDIRGAILGIGELAQTGNVDKFFNDFGQWIDTSIADSGTYNCYLPDDAWRCH